MEHYETSWELSSPSGTLPSTLSSPQALKLLCTSGGRFPPSALEGGGSRGIAYTGGQTRLVSLPSADVTYSDLLAILSKHQWASGSGASTGRLAVEAEQAQPVIRYPLPSEPDVVVDVMDSSDVRLMLEEYAEARAAETGRAPARPHLFVEWPLAAYPSAASSGAGRPGSSLAAHHRGMRSSSPESSLTSEDGGAHHAVGACPVSRAKLQIIPTAAVQLSSILGTGTFGDTFLAKWHDSDVAVKCWSRGVLGMQDCQQEQEWVKFASTADQVVALRHPNLAQMYGILLPYSEEPGERSSAAGLGTQSAGQRQQQQPSGVSQAPGATSSQQVGQPPPAASSIGGEGGGEPSTAEPAGQAGAQPALPLAHGMSGGSETRATIPLHTPALVMEYVPGLSLRQLIERGERELSPAACLVCARDLAKAMEYLHSRGMVHLDLKSSNCLLAWTGQKPVAKATAFGLLPPKLAAAFSPGMSLRRGWWPWLAPEVFHDPGRISENADVFSFGIILWELWAQKKPYEGEGRGFVELVSSSPHPRPALPGSCPGVPARPEPAPGWRALMTRCWAEDPAQRPSFTEVLQSLQGMSREVKERSRRRRQRRQAATGGGGDGEAGAAAGGEGGEEGR